MLADQNGKLAMGENRRAATAEREARVLAAQLDAVRRHFGDDDIIVLGDFNIAPADVDVYDPEKWGEAILCSPLERKAVSLLVFQDLFVVLLLVILELVRQHYADFGPTLAAEKLLACHQQRVSPETLRQWMIAEGLWRPRRERRRYTKEGQG